jgi:hypothetical protein
MIFTVLGHLAVVSFSRNAISPEAFYNHCWHILNKTIILAFLDTNVLDQGRIGNWLDID